MYKILNSVLFFFLLLTPIFSKNGVNPEPSTKEKVEILNNYINFINESIHGLLIVDKLLESYNLDINKYVDLESFKINQYTNKDLPKDIFEDSEHWFYDVSPYEWYNKAKASSLNVGITELSSIQAKADKMLMCIKTINQLRFDLDEVTIGKNLYQKENLDQVYKKLEKGVALYNEFYEIQKKMEKDINEFYIKNKPVINDVEYNEIFNALSDLYNSSKYLVSKLREKDTDTFDQLIKLQTNGIEKMAAIDLTTKKSAKINTGKFASMWSNVIKTSKELNETANKFLYHADVPSNYKMYGKFYYYYNVLAISKFNRYGSGMVFDINNIGDYLNLPVLRKTETPHYFQIIYPKKLDTLGIIEASDDFLSNIPSTLMERKVKVNNRIRVDSDIVELLFYDHMIEDGDIVSINFNGDWILENEELEKGAKRVKLKLNLEGKNYLLLHAVSVGKRPPNTMAFSYIYKGTKKEVIMKSDLDSSELIEILYEK